MPKSDDTCHGQDHLNRLRYCINRQIKLVLYTVIRGDDTIKLIFNNLHNATHDVASDEIYPTSSDSYEEKIESMAEDLIIRTDRYCQRLNMLHFSGLSQREKTKIRKWADKEREKLLHLKEAICEQKRSYLKTIPKKDQTRLANHHPVWKTHYNLYMDQIQKTTIAYEAEKPIIRCTLKPHALSSLKIFREAGDGDVLCINSERALRYDNESSEVRDEVRRISVNNVFFSWRDYAFRPIEKLRLQWIFTHDKWGLNNHILWLDFGTLE